MEINVDPEEINKYMAKKLIESSIGPALKELIDRNVKDLTSGYQNPMEPLVQQKIRDVVATMIEDQYSDKIKEMVKEQITDAFLKKLISSLWLKFIKEY